MKITGLAQHTSWRQRTMPPVEQLAPDLWSIPVPLPGNPLRYISVYALGGRRGLTLIDAGWDSPEAWDALCAGLKSTGGTVADVQACLVTHRHFDHLGLAGRVREASGAWIGMHEADRAVVADPGFHGGALNDVRWMMKLGASAAEAEELKARHGRSNPGPLTLPDRLVADGQSLDIPGWSLTAIHTPGHTVGHLCFVDRQRGLLFSGDHVLPRISPNINVDRDPHRDALADFKRSLEKVASIDVREVLPAHEWRFRGLRERVGQLHEHHRKRLEEVLRAARQEPGSVPWDLAARLTWSRPWSQNQGRVRVSAVLETAAHLVHLHHIGLLTASTGPVPRYFPTDSNAGLLEW